MNHEHHIPRSIIGIIITTWAVGILIGLAAGKAIWKQPCEHCTIVSNVVLRNEQMRTNDGKWATGAFHLVVPSDYSNYTMTFPDFPRGSGKWGGQATNSP